MKVSVYTSVRNGIFFDFHVEAMLRHHLGLADEIVVNEGYSDDGTYDRIKDIDPKIHVYRNRWDRSQPGAWWRTFGNQARRLCAGDWCIKVDCDEFIPEWEFDRVRQLLATTNRALLPVRFTNFYANYRVYNPKSLPRWKFVIHRNAPDAEIVGDGAHVRMASEVWGDDQFFDRMNRDQYDRTSFAEMFGFRPEHAITCHHFGAVRHASRLRQKWRNDGMMKRAKPKFDRLPSFVYDLAPYNWFDEDFLPDLAIYDGPFVKAVRDDPEEFVRDRMKVFDWLRTRQNPSRSSGSDAVAAVTESLDDSGERRSPP
jgi:glycosyltransferase involved in cell wall biosynthesis